MSSLFLGIWRLFLFLDILSFTMRFSIQTKLFLSHFAAIILVTGSVGAYFYQSAIDNLIDALRSRLKNSAALISQGMASVDLDQIRQPEDVQNPVYKRGVESLRDFVKSNPDIAFIYVMRKQTDKVVFVLDSDPVNTAMPGEEYRHQMPALLEGFIQPSVDLEINHDRWGDFLSGYSPLKAGNERYLIGIDMNAEEVQSKLKMIHRAGLLSLAFASILAMFFSRVLSLNFTKRILDVSDRLAAIAPGHQAFSATTQGDELTQLTIAFDQMASRLEVSHRELEHNQEALYKAHDGMEQRVKERTTELLQANQQLLDEIAERKRVERQLEALSQTDYLTGILNRRAITIQLEKAASQARSDEDCFCIILVDLDHFKEINDRFGHDVGDQTLRHAVDRLRHGIRETDLLGRWGGEEFLVMSPNTHLEEAEGLAWRLCKSLSGSRVETGGKIVSVTGSFGVSRFRIGEDLDTCLKRTDDALYAAKAGGRNRIVVHSYTLS